jgi:hypothetical protein
MAFTPGSLYGRYNGSTLGFAFNVSNAGNPNKSQALDLFQIIANGSCVLNVSNSGIVNSPALNPTNGTMIAPVQGSTALGTTAAQVCQATFPVNYNGAQLDLFQISSDIEMNGVENVAGGGGVIFRLLYNGSTSTT